MEQFTPDSFYDFVGLVGVVLGIGSYALLQAGLVRGQTYAYAGMNLLAALFILYSLTDEFNMSSATKQLFMIGISFCGMSRLYLLNRYLRFSQEEHALMSATLPGVSKASARRFFKAGQWTDMKPGELLIKEHEPVQALSYIGKGAFDVTLNGIHLATCRPGSFVGELSWQTKSAATATVVSAGDSRVFSITANVLRNLTIADSELLHALELGLSRDIKSKLMAANEELTARAQSATT